MHPDEPARVASFLIFAERGDVSAGERGIWIGDEDGGEFESFEHAEAEGAVGRNDEAILLPSAENLPARGSCGDGVKHADFAPRGAEKFRRDVARAFDADGERGELAHVDLARDAAGREAIGVDRADEDGVRSRAEPAEIVQRGGEGDGEWAAIRVFDGRGRWTNEGERTPRASVERVIDSANAPLATRAAGELHGVADQLGALRRRGQGDGWQHARASGEDSDFEKLGLLKGNALIGRKSGRASRRCRVTTRIAGEQFDPVSCSAAWCAGKKAGR